MLYRYEFVSGTQFPHTGILGGITEFFDMDVVWDLMKAFEEDLEHPPKYFDYGDETRKLFVRGIFFFTMAGRRRFNREIGQIVNRVPVPVRRIAIHEDVVKILYQDQYQVVIPELEYKKYPYPIAEKIFNKEKENE